jgi:hypothetical protein
MRRGDNERNLTHEQLLQAVGHVAEAALPRWGLAGAALKMINHSENTTYLVTPQWRRAR